jgi:hypothetical protein
MKYLKTYEQCTDQEKLIYDDCRDCEYWQISTKYPDILIAFDKIGCTQRFEWLWSEDNHLIKDVFIYKTYEENGKITWSYSGIDSKNPSYVKPPVFMGLIQISDEDIEEWNMKQNANKYNI